MLFSEFQEGTGCKDNEYNYKVYKDLEVMYMNSNMSKAEIYEYGKKLVDNSKSEQELELEARIKAEIANYKKLIEQERKWLNIYKVAEDNMMLAYTKSLIKQYRTRIKELRWVLA